MKVEEKAAWTKYWDPPTFRSWEEEKELAKEIEEHPVK